MKLTIAYFYPNELNLYGDTGNVEILVSRAEKRGFNTEVITIDSSTKLSKSFFSNIDLVFMGGGPDSGQKNMYEDLINNKAPYLKGFIENQGVALFICGSYQLMGNYYKSADGTTLKGLGLIDFYTQHFGHNKPRSVGNTTAQLTSSILTDPVFKSVNRLGDRIVGFENHGGQTFLSEGVEPLATMLHGNGNNTDDKTEGIHYKNVLGTYFHGPFLSKNAHVADYLLAKASKADSLEPLDDTIILEAYSALLKKYK